MVKTDYQNGDILSARDINDYGTEINAKANKTYVDTELAKKANINDLSEVATSGSYNDLTNKPYIPTKTSDLTNDSGFITQHQDISGKENLSNKVIAVNENSTDIQYPSAKCLYDLIQQIKAEIKLEDHPLYSLYWSLDPTMNEDEANTPSSEKHPHTLFGGTWERIKDRFILAAGNKFGIKSYPDMNTNNYSWFYPVGIGPLEISGEKIFNEVKPFALDSGHNRYLSIQDITFTSKGITYNNISTSVFYDDYNEGTISRPKGTVVIEGESGDVWYTFTNANITSDVYIYFTGGIVARFTPDMFLEGQPNLSNLAGIGGEPIHYQSINEMPNHGHDIRFGGIGAPIYMYGTRIIEGMVAEGVTLDGGLSKDNQYGIFADSTGGNQPHNNMPPYITAYCWMRVPDPISI